MQQLVNVRRPVGQDFLGCLGRRESNDILRPVNLGVDATVADHAGNFGLQTLGFQLQKLRQSCAMNALIVKRDDSDIVLNDTAVKDFVPVLGKLVASLQTGRQGLQLSLVGQWIVDNLLL